ncbi:MAG TPA: hypothetical protein VGF30_00910 [Bacteroidia bacterium]
MKRIAYLFPVIILVASVFSSCKNPPKPNVVYANTFDNFESENMTENKVKGAAYSGQYFIHADSGKVYPYGQVFNLPDSLRNTSLKIFVTAYVRSAEKNPKASFAVTVNGKDSSSFVWKELYMTNQVVTADQWNIFTDSLEISKEEAAFLPLKVNVFGYYPENKKYLDLDDVSITIKSNFKEEE